MYVPNMYATNYGTPYTSQQDNYSRMPLVTPTNYDFNQSPALSKYSPVATSSYNNASFSSGYCSSETSFNNSPYTNYYQPSYNVGNAPIYRAASPQANVAYKPSVAHNTNDYQSSRPVKRSRDESTDDLIDVIFAKQDYQSATRPVKKQCINVNQDNDLKNFPSDENVYGDVDTSIVSISSDKKRVLTKGQRVAANQRERKRMNIMNDAFNELRSNLPISTGRKRRKMSRLDIVVGAMEYIDYLNSLLSTPGNGPLEINFDAYQNSLYMYDD